VLGAGAVPFCTPNALVRRVVRLALRTSGERVGDDARGCRKRQRMEGKVSAGGGNRTRTPLARPRILSPVRLPVPPPRHVVQCVELGEGPVEALMKMLANIS
jgi:hypothetical protein